MQGDRGMPDREERATARRAKSELRHGRTPSTAAGEFVRQEIEHVRHGKHGARSTKQAIAIGLSKARRAGVPLKPRGMTGERKRAAKRDVATGQHLRKPRRPSKTRARATSRALRREPRSAASHRALSRQAHATAKRRGHAERVASARKAVRTKGPVERRAAARKAARTRAREA
jgi:hypothetical protein